MCQASVHAAPLRKRAWAMLQREEGREGGRKEGKKEGREGGREGVREAQPTAFGPAGMFK